jgi:glycosyltransferase involved in cell wall biosynthesis
MRILLTTDPELPVPPKLYGGIERIVDGLIAELRSRQHHVGLVAHPDSQCPVDYFIPWPGRKSNRLTDSLRNTSALWQAVRAFKPDVVHSFSRLAYLLPLLVQARIFGRSEVGSQRSAIRPRFIMSYQRQPTGRQVKRAAQLAGQNLVFTGCSEFIAAQGRQWGGKWAAIPNFVDTAFYRFAPMVVPDAPLIFLSRIERIKGAHTAIAIARKANRRLIIAGNRLEDSEGIRYWEQEIAPWLGRDGIEYIGPVNDPQKNELLGKAAAMLVPVEWDEPFGIVFAEALACGTPVISCPHGALPEIVREGVDGFLVDSVEQACAAIEKLPSIKRADCRRRAETEFNSQVVVEQYLSLYSEFSKRAHT